MVALDARDDEVLSHGWQRGSGKSVLERMRELRAFAGGFLVTTVEREGRMEGPNITGSAWSANSKVTGTEALWPRWGY